MKSTTRTITLSEIADRTGIGLRTLSARRQSMGLGIQRGRTWLLSQSEVERLVHHAPKRGRPRRSSM